MKWHALSTATLAVASVGACSEPVIPDRGGIYSFADTVVIGVDTTITLFRWPESRLPVRVWPDPRGNMAALVAGALRQWEDQFLYGEFRAVLVGDSTTADVIVRWADSVPPDAAPDPTPPNSCGGLTSLDYNTSGSALAGPIHVSLSVLSGGGGPPASPQRVQGCMRRLALHELGHALGLLRHSPFSEDIMFGSPDSNTISTFDRRSVETLYHSRPTVGPPPP